MGDQHNPFAVAVFKQPFIRFQRLNIGRFDGHKHQYKARASNTRQVGVILRRQIIDVAAYRHDVLIHRVLLRLWRFGRTGAIIGIQRHFTVDNDVLIVRQADQVVRLFPASVFVCKGALHLKVLFFHQPAHLQGTAQLRFAPGTTLLGIAFQR